VRSITFGLLLLSLAGCADNGTPALRTGAPGIEVAQAAMRGGSPQMALQIVAGILAKDPTNRAALVMQGDALTALGRLDEAGISFEAALKSDSASVDAHIGLGRLRLGTDPAAAEALFLEALQRQPRNAVALNNLGIARDLLGRHTDAQTAYHEAMAANPSMTAAQVNLALSLAMDGQARNAVQLLRPLASNPGASRQVRHDLAAVLTMSGDKDEAQRILSKDLSATEVRQAMEGYAAARSAGVASMAAPGPAAAPVQITPPVQTMTPTQAAPSVQTTDAASTPPPPAPPVQTAARVQVADLAQTPPPVLASAPAQAAASAQTTASAGTMLVQLTAAASEPAAQAEWRRLQQHAPDVMTGREPSIIKVRRDGHTFWRLRTGGFADAGQANAFCERVHTAGGTCEIAR
jgi:Flp pilus assembly protein TadD